MKNTKFLTSFFFFFGFTAIINGQTLIFNVKDYGAKGDNKTNDYAAIMKAYDAVNAKGKGEIYFPKGTYYIDEFNSDEKRVPDMVLQNLSYLAIRGDAGSIISVKGDFHRPVTKITPTKKYKKSDTYAICPIYIKNSTNVTIENIEIRGNVQSTTRDSDVTESGGRLLSFESSTKVKLNNLYIHHAQMDGIGFISSKKVPNSDFLIQNVIVSNCARQGSTIGSLINARFENCVFKNTGITDGAYGAHNPKAGIDIEPNWSESKVLNLTFDKCIFENNLGGALRISHPFTTENITFNNCTMTAAESGGKYMIIVSAKNVVFNNCTIDCKEKNIYPVWNKPNVSGVFLNCYIKSKSSAFIAVNNDLSRNVIIKNCTIEYTGNKVLKTFFPYLKMNNLVFQDNKIIIPSQYYRVNGPTSLIQNAKLVSGNTFVSNGKIVIPPASFSGSNESR